jgi:hypothetical protein
MSLDRYEPAIRWLIIILALALFVCGIVLSFQGRDLSAAATYVAAIICLVFAYLARFKRFKGLGFEGELWEEKLEEAAHIINRMRSLSVAFSQPILTMAARSGLFDSSFSRRELFDTLTSVENLLRANQIPEDEIVQVRRDVDRLVGWDITIPIIRKINAAIDEAAKVKHQEMEAVKQPITDLPAYNQLAENWRGVLRQKIDRESFLAKLPNSIAVDDLERSLEELTCISDAEKTALKLELKDDLADLRVWLKTRTLRRPEVFLSGQRN